MYHHHTLNITRKHQYDEKMYWTFFEIHPLLWILGHAPFFTGLFWNMPRARYTNLRPTRPKSLVFILKILSKTSQRQRGLWFWSFIWPWHQKMQFWAVFCHFEPCFWHKEDIRFGYEPYITKPLWRWLDLTDGKRQGKICECRQLWQLRNARGGK